jgi:hypothetical protein
MESNLTTTCPEASPGAGTPLSFMALDVIIYLRSELEP